MLSPLSWALRPDRKWRRNNGSYLPSESDDIDLK